jgi:hypothetical protein
MAPTRNVYLRNNIFGNEGAATYYGMIYVEEDSATGFNSDNNCWYCVADTELFGWTGDFAAAQISFADYQTASSCDGQSFLDDPDIDAVGDLLVGSPCINAGATWTGIPATDYSGDTRVQGAAVDIGAYEYAEGGSPAVITALVRIIP